MIAAITKAYRVYFIKANESETDDEDYLVDHSTVMYFVGPDGEFLEFFTSSVVAAGAALVQRHTQTQTADPTEDPRLGARRAPQPSGASQSVSRRPVLRRQPANPPTAFAAFTHHNNDTTADISAKIRGHMEGGGGEVEGTGGVMDFVWMVDRLLGLGKK